MTEALPGGPAAPPRRTAGAVALIALGSLILVSSGLCTSVFGVALLSYASDLDELLRTVALLLACGGPPIAIGAVLLWLGLRRPRS
jgi:hypothetical protein